MRKIQRQSQRFVIGFMASEMKMDVSLSFIERFPRFQIEGKCLFRLRRKFKYRFNAVILIKLLLGIGSFVWVAHVSSQVTVVSRAVTQLEVPRATVLLRK